jgi:hypothetical protein
MRKSNSLVMAPYIEWLAIVCSIVVAVQFCTVLFSNGVLTWGSSLRGE